jgi:hypothetical protein
MKLGLVAGQFGPDIAINFDLILGAEQLEAGKSSPVDEALLGARQPEALRTLAELVL